MENIFNLKRFWLLVCRHANDNWKIFLIFLIIMNVPVIFIYLGNNKPPQRELYSIYIGLLVLVGGIYTGLFFKDWTHSGRSASLLMIPATAFEKMALVLFYTVILFIPVFTVVYYYSCVFLTNIFTPLGEFSFATSELTGIHSFFKVLYLYVLIPYTLCHSIFILSSVWLKKLQFVIALAGIVILYFIFSFWNQYFFQWMIGIKKFNLNPAFLFPTEVQYIAGEDSYYITSPLITNISHILYVIITAIIYIASYFKLKEKEI